MIARKPGSSIMHTTCLLIQTYNFKGHRLMEQDFALKPPYEGKAQAYITQKVQKQEMHTTHL